MKLKLICLLMALLMVLPLAVSCKKDPVTPPASESTVLNIVADGKTDYAIVHSSKITGGNRVTKACVALAETIKEKTGVEIPVKTDAEAASEYEIIIGDTTREESATLKTEIEGNTYGIKAVGNKIVMVGTTDSQIVNAINYFNNNFALNIDSSAKTFTVAKDLSAVFNTAADTKGTITVMGKPISEYTLVVPKISLASEDRIANYLAGRIEDITGDIVRVGSDANQYDNEILIGGTNRTTIAEPEKNTFRISGEGGKLQLRANSMIGYIELYDYILDELFSEVFSNINITENFDYVRGAKENVNGYSEYLTTRKGEYRVLFQNIWGNGSGANHVSRHKMTLELCMAYDADVLGFQEFNPRNRQGGDNAFDKLLEANGYKEVVPSNVTDRSINFTPIFYRADRLELLDCAYYNYPGYNDSGSKSYTWAVFKDKNTGDTFGVLSTHFWWEHDSSNDTGISDNETRVNNAKAVVEALGKIEEKYGKIAVFCGGDYNCNSTSSPIGTILKAGAVSAAFTAKIKDDIQSNHAYPKYSTYYNTYTTPVKPSGDSTKSIDHVLVMNSTAVNLNLYNVSLELYSLLTSDHCALIVDFDVK